MDFDPAALLEEATRATAGLSNFGPEDFRPGFEALCRTYARASLSEAGRKRCRRRLVDLLSTRLRVEAAFERHPEIRDRPILRPMVLTGLPRSGTTALFNLLARDPTTRPLLYWETGHPDPLEALAPDQPDPRRASIVAMIERHRTKNPNFDAMHFTDADAPEECVLLQGLGFHGVQIGVEGLLEPYASFFRSTSPRGMYRYYADLIRMLDWQRPGERWLLKSPAHLWALDDLVAVFPDVSIVWSHRDPLDVIGSAASITLAVAETMGDFDPAELGPKVLEFYAASLERGLESRRALGPERFVDVDYADLVADPIGVVEKIHGHFGLALGDATRAAMDDHRARNPRGKHGSHDYDLSKFGLSSERVQARFRGIDARRDETGRGSHG